MYAKNENGILIFPNPNKDNILSYNQDAAMLEADGYINYSDAEISLYNSGKGYAFDENNRIIDISKTKDYKSKVMAAEKAEKINNLQFQIIELDRKRIRAICEPSMKDESSGQTWLEYYNLLVQDLRNQITALG